VAPAAAPATTQAAAEAASTAAAQTVDASMIAAINSVEWPDNVTVTIDEAAGTWTVTTNGRPSHDTPEQYLLPKAGVNAATVTIDILEPGSAPNQEVQDSWTLPLVPTRSAAAHDMFGAMGISISGGWINDPYEGDQTTIASENNFIIDGVSFIDDCGGHFNPMGYHYHGIPFCVVAIIDTDGEHSRILGFAADGFPMYGSQDVDGAAPTDLDDCRGHFGPTPEYPDGVYHYHLTNEFPYTMLCLSGTPADGTGMNH
jgi:hypothetical protein